MKAQKRACFHVFLHLVLPHYIIMVKSLYIMKWVFFAAVHTLPHGETLIASLLSQIHGVVVCYDFVVGADFEVRVRAALVSGGGAARAVVCATIKM